MFNKGLVIVNAFHLFDEYKHQYIRLKEEFSHFNISLDLISNQEILTYIDKSGNVLAKNLKYDFIIYLDKDYYIAKMLEHAGYRLFNNAEVIRICDDKMLTHLSLINNDIRMPKTINFPLKFFLKDDYLDFIDNVINELGFPFIVKNSFGSLGEQVHLIHNKEEILEYEKNNHMYAHIFQEYIKSSFGKDFRLVTVGGRFVSSMYRVAQDANEFRSNIELGGVGSDLTPPQDFIDLAEKISQILNIDYCGLDFMFDEDGKPVFNEINANAFFGPIEKYNPINVGKAYAEYVYKTIYKKETH